MSVIITTIASIFVFSVVILIHEFGHYWTARRCGIRVNEFSIGMGPALVCWVKNGIQYSLRLLPIGGYVSMEGEDGEVDPDERPEGASGLPFGKVSIPRRVLVVAAGALMNFVLGFLVLLILICNQDQIVSRKIYSFSDGAMCHATGLEVGDEILAVNGRRCFVANDIVYELARTENGRADFTVRRDGATVQLQDVQFDTQQQEDGTTRMSLGFVVYGLKKTPLNVLKETGCSVL